MAWVLFFGFIALVLVRVPITMAIGAAVLASLSRTLRSRGDFLGALAAAQTAVRLNAEDSEAHNNLGTTLGAKGLVDQAIIHLRWAVQAQPVLSSPTRKSGFFVRVHV